jgi:hypothetical protein
MPARRSRFAAGSKLRGQLAKRHSRSQTPQLRATSRPPRIIFCEPDPLPPSPVHRRSVS